MSQEQDLEQIEISLENAKKQIDLAKSLDILMGNAHFKKVFLDKYLDSYIVRLVKLKASMGMQKEEHQVNIANQLNGIGQMNQYMLYIANEGQMAQKAIEDYDEAKDAILNEEG